MNDKDLLAQLQSLNTGFEDKESTAAVYAQTHCGVISGSNIGAFCTFQPDPATMAQLELDIEELSYKIATSKTGKTATNEKLLASKTSQLERMLSNELPDGAIELCERIAPKRAWGYCAESDVDTTTKAMAWGKKYEHFAVDAIIEKYPDIDLRNTKENQLFFKLDGFDYVGCTPDGGIYLNDKRDAASDIKCPFERAIHVKNMRIKTFADLKRKDPNYYWQFHLQMLCFGVTKHSFFSFDPRPPEEFKHLRLIRHDFDLVQADADFMLSRIVAAEKLINKIISEF